MYVAYVFIYLFSEKGIIQTKKHTTHNNNNNSNKNVNNNF